jgi:hypothetical protein
MFNLCNQEREDIKLSLVDDNKYKS